MDGRRANEIFQWALIAALAAFVAESTAAFAQARLQPPPPSLAVPAVEVTAPNVQTAPLASLLATTRPAFAPNPETTETTQNKGTSLPQLTLVGTMAGPNGAGLAFLEQGSELKCLGQGDSVTGSVTISRVDSASLTFSNGVTLELGERSGSRDPDEVVPSPAATVEPIRSQDELRKLLEQPEKIFQNGFSAKPFMREGQMVGAVLTIPGPTHPLARLGLQSGDVVKSLNQRPLDKPGAISQLLPVLRNSDTLVLELEREGKPRKLVVELE